MYQQHSFSKNKNKQPQQNHKISQKNSLKLLSIQSDDPIYLRTDVNQLFEDMTFSANFNLKKYKNLKFIQLKEKNQSPNVTQNEHHLKDHKQKILTEPTEEIFYNQQLLKQSFKKISRFQTQTEDVNNFEKLQFNLCHEENKTNKKASLLNTTNFDKLLKKNQYKTQYNESFLNKKKSTKNDFNKTTFDMKAQQKNIITYNRHHSISQKVKNVPNNSLRKKIISFNKKNIQTDSLSIDVKDSLRKTNVARFSEANQSKLNKKQNTYEKLQKQHNKGGPLKFKHIQNWLNNIIQEYCHDQYFDTSLTSAALKKYYIDSNSLMSNGVEPKDVSRIYNSLFVYSIGFNNLIKQISKGNKQLVKNIWKVFSLLLEYCAAGNYQTLVGELERQKIRKVQELKLQIQKRQQIIEKNQEVNDQRNNSMFKQLKRLKEQNINLANERQILLEDFQLADQAFTQQVSLRLKFQNTINQLYGVHRQLTNKHGRLYFDFQQKIEDLKKASQKYFEQTKLTQKYKNQLIELKQKHNELKKININDKKHIEAILQELSKIKQDYFSTLKQVEELRFVNIQKIRKIQQMQIQHKNNMIVLQLRQKSAKQTHSEYQITLQENNKLFKVISQQRAQMQVLLKQKKQFNNNVLKIMSDSSYYKKKYQTAQKEIRGLTQNKTDLQILSHKLQLKIDILEKQIQSYKNDLQSNYENIKKMHQRNFQLEQQLIYLRKYEGNMDNFIGEKDKIIDQLKNNIQNLQKDFTKEKQQFIELDSKYKILETQFRAQQQSNMKKIQMLRKQQQTSSTNQNSLSTLLKSTQMQIDRYKTLFNNALMDFKHQKFQRSNLSLNYQQILKVLQKKKVEQKQADIKINQLQELINEYKQKYKIIHLNLIDTTQKLTSRINNLEQTCKQLKQIVNKRSHHIHPMIFQDIFQRLQRQYEFKNIFNQKFEQFKINQETKNEQLRKQIKKLKNTFQNQKNKLIIQETKIKQKLKNELQYEKNQKQKIKNKLITLQQLQRTYNQKIVIYQQRQKQQKNQQQLMNQITEKNKKIALLYQQIQKIHDLKTNQIKNLQEKIKKVEDQKLNFIYQFKMKKQRQIKQQIQKQYQSHIQKIKNQYEQKSKNKTNILQDVQISELVNNQKLIKKLIMKKSLDQILLIKKQQLSTVNQIQKQQFYSNIQQFFRNQFNPNKQLIFNKTNSFNPYNKTNYKTKFNDKIPEYLKKMQNNQDIKKRTDAAKKIKLTYQYYGKNNTTLK